MADIAEAEAFLDAINSDVFIAYKVSDADPLIKTQRVADFSSHPVREKPSQSTENQPVSSTKTEASLNGSLTILKLFRDIAHYDKLNIPRGCAACLNGHEG